jgi:hypothetical protein
MRFVGLTFVVFTITQPLYAGDGVRRATSADSVPFIDTHALSVPDPERTLVAQEGLVSLGVRASSAVANGDFLRGGPSIVAALSFELSRNSFVPTRALSWGLSQSAATTLAFGYGYQLGARYGVGAFVATDKTGSGAFLVIGAEGEGRSLGRSPLVRLWGYPALGYSLRNEHTRIDLAIIPSLGGISVIHAAGELPLWVRERLRVRLWHVRFELEHGKSMVSEANAGYLQGSICSDADRNPLIACTSAAVFERTSDQLDRVSEVSISVGLGRLLSSLAPPTR